MNKSMKVVLCVVAAIAALATVAATPKPASGMVWEYKVKEMQFGPTGKAEAELNRLGQEGWELVSDSVTSPVEHQSKNHVFVLKRAAR